jgi:hypothetical protein
VIIVLDATAIVSDPLCSGLAWKVLAHAHNAWAVRCVISDVSVLESIAGYRRRLKEAVVGLDRWGSKHVALGLDVQAKAIREVIDELGSEYPDRLDRMLRDAGVEVLPVPNVAHLTLVERATQRIKPCDSNGDGYRDTLNWFLILALVRSDKSEDLIWVSENTKDFADTEEKGLHEELLEELREKGASERVTWLPKLGDAVLCISEKYTTNVEDLAHLHRRVQEDTLRAFLDQTVLPTLVEQSVSPRRCALPLASRTALIAALGQVTKLEWTPRGAVEADETVVEFSARAETALLVTMDARFAAEDPSVTTVAVEPDEATVQLVKTLVMRGLLTLDKWGMPQRGEITRVEALVDDPRRNEWLAYDVGQTVRDGLRDWRMPIIPPEVFKAIKMPIIPPEVFKAIKMPIIPPEVFKAIKMPIIPPEVFKAIWPDLFKGKGGFGPPKGPRGTQSGRAEPPSSREASDEDQSPPASREGSGESEPTDDDEEPLTDDKDD